MTQTSAPTLVFIIGPPAVGKMTVGYALAHRTGLTLFHNHHTIDLVLRFFPFGTPPFGRLVSEFRRRIMEEVADSDMPGLIFTYVWAFDQPSDHAAVARLAEIFASRGGRVLYVEWPPRRRNACAATRPNSAWPKSRSSATSPCRASGCWSTTASIASTPPASSTAADWLRIDNTDLPPETVAARIIDHFALPRTTGE